MSFSKTGPRTTRIRSTTCTIGSLPRTNRIGRRCACLIRWSRQSSAPLTILDCSDMNTTTSPFASLVESDDPGIYELTTRSVGPEGKLPLTDELLRHAPSGDLFGWSQNVGMGWKPELLGRKEFLILSTHGGL